MPRRRYSVDLCHRLSAAAESKAAIQGALPRGKGGWFQCALVTIIMAATPVCRTYSPLDDDMRTTMRALRGALYPDGATQLPTMNRTRQAQFCAITLPAKHPIKLRLSSCSLKSELGLVAINRTPIYSPLRAEADEVSWRDYWVVSCLLHQKGQDPTFLCQRTIRLR